MATPSPLGNAGLNQRGAVPADGSLAGGAVVSHRFARVPRAQTLLAASDTLVGGAALVYMTAGAADKKITATPTMEAGTVIGEERQYVNVGANLVTLQGSDLASSGLRMRSKFVTLATNCGITVFWDGTNWIEQSRTTYGSPGVLDPRDFGADPTYTYDSTPAFNKMTAAFIANEGGDLWRGGYVHIARGKYMMKASRTMPVSGRKVAWEVAKRMVIRGDGCGYQLGNAATLLMADTDVTCIRFWCAEADGPDGPAPDVGGYAGSAAYSIISDIGLAAVGKNAEASGLYSSTQIRVERMMVGDFATDGYFLQANSALDGSGNANSSAFTDCSVGGCGRDGFHLEGSDVNSTLLLRCFSTHNDGWQYNVESWLGSFLQVCNAECGIGKGTFRTSGGGSTLFMCYIEYGSNYATSIAPTDFIDRCNFDYQANAPLIEIEGDGSGAEGLVVGIGAGDGTGISTILVTQQGQNYTVASARVIRGGGQGADSTGGATFTVQLSGGKIVGLLPNNPGSGFEFGASGCSMTMAGSGNQLIDGGVQFRQRTKGVVRAVDLWIGGYGTNGAPLLSASVADRGRDSGPPTRFNQIAWNEAVQCFETQFCHTAGTGGVRHVFPGSVNQTGGRSTELPANSVMFPNGYWLGDGVNARYRGTAAAPPTTGEWAQGDSIDNINRAVGVTRGWDCTHSGIFGTGDPPIWTPQPVL